MIHFDIPGFQYPSSSNTPPILEKQSLLLETGKWTALVGRSGSGKSTLLRLLAGYFDMTDARFDIALLSQEAALFPWLSLTKNIGISDLIQGHSIQEEKVQQLLALVGLEKDAPKKPTEISYGMQRRILLARTLYLDRPIIFLDEPFSAVDPKTRENLYKNAKKWLHGRTVLFTTHQWDEAKTLGDAIYELQGSPGVLVKLERTQKMKEGN